MKEIAIIQFRVSDQTRLREQKAFLRSFDSLATRLTFKNAFLDSLQWNEPEQIIQGAQGVIFGGSGEFDFDGGRHEEDERKVASHALVLSMEPFLQYLSAQDFPVLGICFGHQILGKAHGVSVVHDKSQAKVGTHTIQLTEEAKDDPLFHGLPDSFLVQYGHKDSLSELPQGATLLARGEQCQYSALRFGNKRYSLQFHPELSADDIRLRFETNPEYLPQGLSPQHLVQESPHASILLTNFIKNIL